MTFDFLIFDCDGVLVDSEWLVARIEVETRAEFGQQISIEEYIRRYVGLSTRSPEYLKSLEGLPSEFRALMKERIERAFHEELEAIPGVAETLEQLKAWPKAIASSSSPWEIEMMLEHTNLLEHFRIPPQSSQFQVPPQSSGGVRGGKMSGEASASRAYNIYSVSMVARPKPAPDVYLHAAEQNNVLPSQCLVIEDSVVGATAALSAGMTVWGFTGARHQTAQSKQRLSELGVSRIISHMSELPALLNISPLAAQNSPLPAGGLGGVSRAPSLPSWRKLPSENRKRAIELRNNATAAEKELWYKIRNEQLGVKFRRQHPIGPFIVDFYSHEAALVIEIDGATHSTDDEMAYDRRRTEYLASRGLRELRFNNQDVLKNAEGVVSTILQAITPPNPPASRGE